MSESETNGLISEKSDEVRAAAEAQIVDESSQIQFFIAEYTIGHLADAMNKKDFVVPDYQREFTWDSERKSKSVLTVLSAASILATRDWLDPKRG